MKKIKQGQYELHIVDDTEASLNEDIISKQYEIYDLLYTLTHKEKVSSGDYKELTDAMNILCNDIKVLFVKLALHMVLNNLLKKGETNNG